MCLQQSFPTDSVDSNVTGGVEDVTTATMHTLTHTSACSTWRCWKKPDTAETSASTIGYVEMCCSSNSASRGSSSAVSGLKQHTSTSRKGIPRSHNNRIVRSTLGRRTRNECLQPAAQVHNHTCTACALHWIVTRRHTNIKCQKNVTLQQTMDPAQAWAEPASRAILLCMPQKGLRRRLARACSSASTSRARSVRLKPRGSAGW